MRKAGSFLLLLIAALFIMGCSSDQTLVVPPDPQPPDEGENPETPQVVLSEVTVVSSSNILQSDGALPVTITARVIDESNIAVEGIAVSFAADSGVLTVASDTTDASGRATATLSTEEDPTNRTITVTASASGIDGLTLTGAATVQVIGTEFSPIAGPGSIVIGAVQEYSTVLVDGNGNGIAGVPITVTSSLGNPITPDALETNFEGNVTFSLTAQNGGTDQILVSGLGIERALPLEISTDSFVFVTPTPPNANQDPPRVPLNTMQTVQVRWETSGAPVDGQPVQFSTTRGTLADNGQVITVNGVATNTITSSNAGRAVITATAAVGDGPSAQLPIDFIATQPASIEVQADPFNIGPNEQSAIRATVRDPQNNLVTDQTVIFELDDVTNGSLTVGTAITNTQGEAQTFYVASSSTSASEGVRITARVQNTNITDVAAITVARREVFFTFGTGNTITEVDDATYELPLLVQASDADGNGVAGVDIQLSVLTERYIKGYWAGDAVANRWFVISNVVCDEEDRNRNGFLDPGEDDNNNGEIDVGNNANIPGTVTTDAAGEALTAISYAQQFGSWLQVIVEARTDVEGSSFSETASFILPTAASDINSIQVTPPGVGVALDPANGYPNAASDGLATGPVSPFGYGFSCFIDI
ncbi:MAG: Ig-like domain-containing protein [Pseudomonadota bacterium]